MKIVEYYQCEFCGSIYKKEEMARKCEAQGKPEARFSIGATVWVIWANGKTPGTVERISYVRGRLPEKVDITEVAFETLSVIKSQVRPHQIRYYIKISNRPSTFIYTGEERLSARDK